MLLNDFLQSWIDQRAPERLDFAAGDRGPQPFVPNPEPLPGIVGNLTDYGRLADAFRANNNLITSASEWIGFTNALSGMVEDPNFDVFRDYDFKGMERFAYQFGWAKSREQADEVRRRLTEDMGARQRFSELDPLTQFVVGAIASTGPADIVPFGLGRGILAGGAIAGAAIGTQSIARNSMALQPGDWKDAAFDAASGALFTGGYNAARRLLMPEHAPQLEGLRRAGDAEAAAGQQGPSAGPLRPEGMAPGRQADVDPHPFVIHEGDLTVRAGPDGPIETPRGDGHAAPFVMTEEGEKLGGKADFTDDRPVPSSQPLNFAEPMLTDGKRVYDLGRPFTITDAEPPPIVTGASVLERPGIVVTENGRTMLVDVPSPAEVVQGRLSSAPAEARGVKVMEGVDLATAETEIKAGRPVVIAEDSSVGARQANNVWTDNDSRLASAGGLERLSLTPAAANLASPNPEVRESMAALANHSMVVEGNTRGLAGQQSVEARHMALNAPRIVDTVHGWWADYAEYAKAVGGGAMASGFSRTLDFVGTRVANLGNGPAYKDFMREVAGAIVDGGQHMNPVVQRAAQRFGVVAEDLRNQAAQVGYWDFLFQMRIDDLKARRAATQDPNRIARLDHEIAQAQLDHTTSQAAGGPRPTGDRGYLPRYYRYDKIMAERGQVEAIIDARIAQLGGVSDPVTGTPYTGKQAVDILLNIDPHTGAPRPYVKPKGDQWAHSGKERGFDWIPTKMLWDYVETDAEVLLRRYVRQMGVDVELTRQFGDPFMMREIQRLAGAGASMREIENVMFVRDVIKGSHAPMDPTSIVTHSVQAAKMLANMTVLGAQTITAFTDLARPFMTEGIQRTLGTTFDLISDGFHGLKLHRAEAEMLGSSGEMVLSLRQQAFANGSSAFASTPGWLQGIERMHSAFFMLNGIAPWTEIMKTWQSTITTTRIMEDIRKAAAGTLNDAEMQRLATIGLDDKIAGDIVAQLDQHQVHLGRTTMPNIAAWNPGEAAERFRTAIWQATNRSIVTPGAADIPRWTVEGTSWLPAGAAQVIAMYHNYGVALHHKLVMAGLQGGDASFMAGALALVGLGYMVDHIRDELNTVGERKARFKSTGERLMSAVDRSGLLGYATNVNNAIERLSFNTVGVKPFTGQVRWGEGSVVAAMGGLGPVGSWAGNLYRTVNGEAHDRRGWSEAQAMRKMLPLNTLFWMDGLFDRIQENWYDPERQKNLAAEQRKRYAARRATTYDGGE